MSNSSWPTGYCVRLDIEALPESGDKVHSLQAAEAQLCFCNLYQIWEDPQKKQRLFYVWEKPQDIPQLGIFWVEEPFRLPPMNW